MRGRLTAFLSGLIATLALPPAAAQTTCTSSIRVDTESNTHFSSTRGQSHVVVETQPGCTWRAESSQGFVTFGGGMTVLHGTGLARLFFLVAPNFTPHARTSVLRVGGSSVEIFQGRGTPLIDFDRDGHADLLWQHANGEIAAWLMDGLALRAGRSFTPSTVPDPNWRLAGAGDLDADGSPDLIWQHTTDGRVAAWLLNGLLLVRGDLLSIATVPDTGWRIGAVGDLDGDGHADLFWRHATQGLVAVWLMDGLRVVDARLVDAPPVADVAWRLAGVTRSRVHGGGLDLLWHHDTDGRVAVWQISETARLIDGSVYTRVPDTDWTLVAVSDLDRDGRADWVWRHRLDGRISVWLASYSPEIATVADSNWRVAGPR